MIINPYKDLSNHVYAQILEMQENGHTFDYISLNEGNCIICTENNEECFGRVCIMCNVCLCKDHYSSHLKYHK